MTSIFVGNTFKSLPVEFSKYGLSPSRLRQLHHELVLRPEQSQSIAVVTLSLALPDDGKYRQFKELIRAFEKSLRDELRWSGDKRLEHNKRFYQSNVRFLWAYDVDGERRPKTRTWRLAIAIHGHELREAATAVTEFKLFAKMAWCRALGFSKFKPGSLVKLGRKPVVTLDKTSNDYFTELEHVFRRLSLLAQLPA